MDEPVSDLTALLISMEPVLNPGVYVYASLPFDAELSGIQPVGFFREQEGLTVILEEKAARVANLQAVFRAAWITLTVHSDLSAVGFSAAVAAACARVNVSCNVIAGVFHDHLFVPVEAAGRAMDSLRSLQRQAKNSTRR